MRQGSLGGKKLPVVPRLRATTTRPYGNGRNVRLVWFAERGFQQRGFPRDGSFPRV